MSYAYNELFMGKASIYALVENGSRWEDKGTGGQLRLYRNKQLPNDVQIGWFKDAVQLWWRLSPGKHAKLRKKGQRAWVVKANSTNSGDLETLALRFSAEQDSLAFEKQYNAIFAPQQGQQGPQQAQSLPAQKPVAAAPQQIQQQPVYNGQMSPTYGVQQAGYGAVQGGQMPMSMPLANGMGYMNNGMQYSGSLPQMNGYMNQMNMNQMTQLQMMQQQMAAQQQQQQMHSMSYGQGMSGFGSPNSVGSGSGVGSLNNNFAGYQQQGVQQRQQGQQGLGMQQHQQHPSLQAAGSGGVQMPRLQNGLSNLTQQVQAHKEAQALAQRQGYGQGQGGQGQGQGQRVSLVAVEDQSMQPEGSNVQPPKILMNRDYKPPVESATTWKCGVCTYNNQGERQDCGLCGMKRRRGSEESSVQGVPVMPPPTPQSSKWKCGKCACGNDAGAQKCNFCGAQRTSFTFDRQPSVMGGQWRCVVCTLVNDAGAKSCEACNKPRPNKKAAMRGGGMGGAFGLNFDNKVSVIVDDDDEDDDDGGQVNINGNSSVAAAHQMLDDLKIADKGNEFGDGDMQLKAPTDRFGNIISSAKDFENACSDIVACNTNPSPVFNTLKSVSRKLTKDDVRYRTLDLQNPRVVERLIGYEGVLDFLTLLGFTPDENGIKLVCEKKPNDQVIRNAVAVLQSYENKLGFSKKKRKNVEKMGGAALRNGDGFGDTPQGPDAGDAGIELASTVNQDEEDAEMSVDQIIAWGTHEFSRDTESITTLIMTHVLYTDSLSLLRALRKRYFVAIPGEIRDSGNKKKIDDFQENVQKRIQLKVLKALKDWMKSYWETDFGSNEALRNEVLAFVDQMEKKHEECPWNVKFAQMIRNDFTRNCQKGGPRRSSGKKLENVQIPKNYDIRNTRKIKFEEFADQITLMDFALFEKIEARECLGQAWKKKDSMKRAPNVLALIKQFNNVTTMIQMHILHEKGLGKRVKRLTYILRMGERFRDTHNYNALCAVFSALNSAPVHRLKSLWKKLNEKEKKSFEGWRKIFDSAGNHRNLRASLRSATGACIPHIGIFLQDLVFIEDGNQTRKVISGLMSEMSGKKLVNFAKQMKLADRIQYIQRYQQINYNMIQPNDVFQKCLLDEFEKFKDLTEDEIWEMSTAVRDADKK